MVSTVVIHRLYWTLSMSSSLNREGTENDMYLFKKKCICYEGLQNQSLSCSSRNDRRKRSTAPPSLDNELCHRDRSHVG